MKHEIFNLLDRFGLHSAHHNWREYVEGYGELTGKGGVLQHISPARSRILYSCECIQRVLEIDAFDLEQPIRQVPAIDGATGEVYLIDWSDFALTSVVLPAFAQWLKLILLGKAQVATQVDEEKLRICYTINDVDVYFLFPLNLEQLRTFILELNPEKKHILLFCSQVFFASSSCKAFLAERPQISAHAINEFIAFSQKADCYEYVGKTPFAQYVSGFMQRVKASFLARPEGANWENLEIVIIGAKSHLNHVTDEHILAHYNQKERVYEQLSKIRDLKGEGKKKSAAFLLLCELARNGGSLRIDAEFTSAKLSRLRQKLRAMFGYRKDEDPLPNPSHNDSLVKAKFKIRFSDGESDPLLRMQALREYLDEKY